MKLKNEKEEQIQTNEINIETEIESINDISTND